MHPRAAVWLLQEQGYDLTGITMVLFPGGEGCGEEAAQAARQLGIPHHLLDLSQTFRQEVMDAFVRAYEAGRTPNPCVVCNRKLKFGALLDKAWELGCGKLATGHYVRLEEDRGSGRFLLKKALRPEKDQSYVLAGLNQEKLSRSLFPLGALSKEEVRSIAAQADLINAKKGDSQDICFIPDGDYAAFLERQGVTLRPGNFVDASGRVLGPHRGLERYTTGQRKGLGVSAGEPVYVLRKDLASGDVVLGPDSALYTHTLTAERMNWISIPQLKQPMRVKAKTRYRQAEQWAAVYPEQHGRVRLEFDVPQRAVTVGQAVVLYDGDVVVGGGTICQAPPTKR